MEALVAALARGLVRLGELVAPARDAVARALIGIGYKIHTLLCDLTVLCSWIYQLVSLMR